MDQTEEGRAGGQPAPPSGLAAEREWRSRVLIGTCAWSDHEAFYPPGTKATDRISYYARRFPVVEVNSSFHNPLPPSTYGGWADRTPDGFVFHVKAYSALTLHRRDEQPTAERFAAFRASYRPLAVAGKLGAVLFQFPPWFAADEAHRTHLARVAEAMAGDRSVVELRHPSWFADEQRAATLALLGRLELGHVVVDAPRTGPGAMPLVAATTGSALAYVRLHGRGGAPDDPFAARTNGRPNYLYAADELEDLVPVVRALAVAARRVSVMFNNQRRYSTVNAEMFRRRLGQLERPPETDLGRQLPLLGG